MKGLVLQHLSVEHPGIFRDFFAADGIRLQTVELDAGEPIPDLGGFAFMIAMGGPQDVWQEAEHAWLVPEKAAIRHFVAEMKRPFLGICLGHQLLAEAIGGKVGKCETAEVGVLGVSKTAAGKQDRLLAGTPDPMSVLQWHGAEVKALPQGAAVLAGSPVSPVQIFRYGEYAYGLQCHVEISKVTVDEWAAVPAYAQSLEQTLGKGAVDRLRQAVADRLPQFNRDARALYDNFRAMLFEARADDVA
jgi:GMP synthase-like glutamine amidotransferase